MHVFATWLCMEDLIGLSFPGGSNPSPSCSEAWPYWACMYADRCQGRCQCDCSEYSTLYSVVTNSHPILLWFGKCCFCSIMSRAWFSSISHTQVAFPSSQLTESETIPQISPNQGAKNPFHPLVFPDVSGRLELVMTHASYQRLLTHFWQF